MSPLIVAIAMIALLGVTLAAELESLDLDLGSLRGQKLQKCEDQCKGIACKQQCAAQISVLMDPQQKGGATALLAQLSSDAVIPFDYPLVKQCGEPWADDLMGNKTICAVGCLMSSTSMGMAGVQIQIPNASGDLENANPGTFNSWLKENEGYANNSLIESVVPKIDPARIAWPEDAMHKTNDLSYETVCEYIKAGRIVIGNVHQGEHFVLLTGYSATDGDTIYVNDSGFNTLFYSYKNDIVGYRIFDMQRI